MPVKLDRYKLAYFPVPKCACTSLKHFFFEVENGRPFEDFWINGVRHRIHRVGYQPARADNLDRSLYEGFYRFAVVRDPVKRFLSAYVNRVVQAKELAWRHVKEARLPPDPDLPLFIERLDEYLAASAEVRHHFQPMAAFLGDDPSWFTKVFDISELSSLEAHVKEITGVDASIPRLNAKGPKIDPSQLPVRQRQKIEQYYEADYAFIGGGVS